MPRLKSIPFKNRLPEVDPLEARMLRGLGMDAEKSAKLGLAAEEADQEMTTLAATVSRALYHRRRFLWIVDEARERYDAHKADILFDMIAKYIAFEAAGLLGAARSFVDGVFHLALRRSGASIEEASDPTLAQAIANKQAVGHGLPEVVLLRDHHLGWYELVNVYRNVVVHVGSGDSLGFFPIGAVLPPGVEPETNVMVMPDFASLKKVDMDPKTKKPKKRARTTRPHEWTYRTSTRLETVAKEAYDGLIGFAGAVGVLWGGSLPRRGDSEMRDALVLR